MEASPAAVEVEKTPDVTTLAEAVDWLEGKLGHDDPQTAAARSRLVACQHCWPLAVR